MFTEVITRRTKISISSTFRTEQNQIPNHQRWLMLLNANLDPGISTKLYVTRARNTVILLPNVSRKFSNITEGWTFYYRTPKTTPESSAPRLSSNFPLTRLSRIAICSTRCTLFSLYQQHLSCTHSYS